MHSTDYRSSFFFAIASTESKSTAMPSQVFDFILRPRSFTRHLSEGNPFPASWLAFHLHSCFDWLFLLEYRCTAARHILATSILQPGENTK